MDRHILLIGATGVFGRRLAAHLSTFSGVRLTLASRSQVRAQALAAGLASHAAAIAPCAGIGLDTSSPLEERFRHLALWLVIDASGPFQERDHRVAAAALTAGAHYIDLADARSYLEGFAGALDDLARRQGLTALAGASSTPALSSAVVGELTAGWQRIDTIDMAITPAGRSDVGPAVIGAILSYAGQPVPILLDGVMTTRCGWCEGTLIDVPGLGRRRAALVDTYDAEALSRRFGVVSRIVFRAGLESWVEQFGLMALARLRRATGFRLRPAIVDWLAAMRRVTRVLTGNRGGMLVEATGLDGSGQWCRASWCLLAGDGHGPHVPTLPAAAVVRGLLAGEVPIGARPCVGVAPLVAIEAEMRPYRITTARSHTTARDGDGAFPQALGSAFADLPEGVRRFHLETAPPVWRGFAMVEGSTGIVARVVRRIVGLPDPMQGPVTVTVDRRPAVAAGSLDSPAGLGSRDAGAPAPLVETWRRTFGSQRVVSEISAASRGRLIERFGPLRFELHPEASPHGLTLSVGAWSVWHMPMPRALAPRCAASETVDPNGRFQFDVRLTIPVIGLIAHYRGWLEPALTRGEDSSPGATLSLEHDEARHPCQSQAPSSPH